MPHKTVEQTKLDKLPGALISREPHLATLTPKQAMFAMEYVAGGFNASAAAEHAGYNAAKKTFAQIGWENLRKNNVRDAVQVEIAKQVEAIGWSKEKAIAVIHRIMMRSIEEEAFPSAIAAWGKLGDVTGVVAEMQDKSLTITFHSDAAAADDPANAKDVTPIGPANARDAG